MNLVVVESPAKAKTIKKYLGKDYNVLASMGHVRDLPSQNGSVDVEHDFAMKYQVKQGSQRNVDAIVKAAKESDAVFLASDPDREGEAIAWHVAQILLQKKAVKEDKIFRCKFTEITPNAIKASISNPGFLDQSLINAQQARLALDYLVGFNLSPVLWKKLPGSKSAGRVQSVALRLIVENELKIKAFKSKEYWTIGLDFGHASKDKSSFANVVEHQGVKFSHDHPGEQLYAEKIVDEIMQQAECKVLSKKTKDFKQNPYPPFITSTLQQDASYKLGFSSKKTMQIAQKLYEGVSLGSKTIGLITYMRTDGTTISEDALKNIRGVVAKTFGEEYLPKSANVYKTKVRNAQEAHEAIRPTDATLTPDDVKPFLDKDQLSLYSLIWKRAVACQMNPAIKTSDSIEFVIEKTKTIAKMSNVSIKFDGFLRLYSAADEDVERANIMQGLKEGDVVKIKKAVPAQHFTLPPARYNEASLIKKMEELGIGRPSTYSTIISVIQERDYAKIEKKQFFAELKGMMVIAFLVEFFLKYVEYDFTAKLEEELDDISTGKLDKLKFLNGFWAPFHAAVVDGENLDYGVVSKTITSFLKTYIFVSGSISEECNVCHKGVMELHSGRFGAYLRCSDVGGCKNVVNFEKWKSAESEGFGEQTIVEGAKEIVLKGGPYGKYIQVTDGDKKKNVPIPKQITDITEDVLKKYANLPIELGMHPEKGKIIFANIGRFGPYVQCDGLFASIKGKDLFDVTLEDAIEFIKTKESSGGGKSFKHPQTGEPIKVGKKNGVYIAYKRKFYSIKNVENVQDVTIEHIMSAIGEAKDSKGKK